MEDTETNWGSMLPENVQKVLRSLISEAEEAFGPDLVSIVLFGSAAEGKLRATSDVNLLFLLERFDRKRADPFREALRVGYTACKLSAMFVLRSEIDIAFDAFAVKFADISRRHRVLYGQDLLSAHAVSRDAKIRTLRQTLLNLTIRLRERYMIASLREEQLALVVAEVASPVRSAAAAILELEGRGAASPKQALETLIGSLEGSAWGELLQRLSQARETRSLPPGVASETIGSLMALVEAMRDCVERLA
jgi:predicted nucleotidyltransferase